MLNRTLLIAVPFLLLTLPVQAKEKLMILSWGDVIWQHKGEGTAQLDTPEKVVEAARIWKERGQEEDMGLPPIEDAVRQSYGPLCERFGAGLYLAPGGFRMSFRHPAHGRGSQTPELRKSLVSAFEKEPAVTGIVYGYGEIMKGR